MTDHRYYMEILNDRPELFRRVVRFNVDRQPAADAAEGPAPQGVLRHASVLRALRGARPAPIREWNDFTTEPARLALLPDDVLHRLFLLFAASVHAEEMARLINGKAVRQLQQALGANVYAFAIKRGRYALGSLQEALRREGTADDLADRIIRLAGAIPALLGAGLPDFPPLPQDRKVAVWHALKLILLREVAPQWAPCFD